MATASKPRVSKIVGIQFSILSPEEIRKGAVTEITSRDTYIGNKPVLGGLFCPYMGVSEPGMLCPTDGLDYMNTPGYFGRIELAMPVFYYQHLNTIHKILRCVCLKCSRLLINKEEHKQALKMSPDERWAYVFGVASKVKQVKRCGDVNDEGCGCLMPKKIRKENLATLIAEWDSDGIKGMSEEDAKKMNMQLTPDIVLKIFRRISDDDVSFMGFSPTFSRPDWMICQVLAVPPPAVRPSIKMDGQQRSEDDLTHIIVNIVKANKTLQEKLRDGAQANVWHMVLQYYCATLVDNNIPGAAPAAQRSGRKLKSIKERLNGKGGRVRGNLMGKRVDFSARSVITPDPNLSIRELGVPLKIAKNITKPVVVNDMNRRFLMRLVRNGPEEYPGAKILERKGGESISLRYADRENIVLYNGDIVHRHMMDGDGVLFNRQPTLHRMSMMCHIARIMRQGDTFRMNVGDTKPYNADFDGDEMNMHMPQDEEAEAELKNLAAVPYQIISPAKNQSIIGIFQDSLVGSYRFTRPGVSFTPRDAMNLLMAYNGVNEGLFAGHAERITSFQILSQIMPAFTMKYKTKGFGENDDFATSPGVLEIVDGKYLRGQLDKDVLGGGSNGLITRTCNDFGNMAASDFIDNLQNIVTEYMKGSAYSVGISDLIANRSTNEQIAQSITSKKKEVKNLIDQTYLGIFENATGNTNEDEFEFQVTNILNKATNDSGKIGLKSLDKDNRFVTMVKAGSKGSDLNISQMIACLGQQLIDGKRIPYGFENRTLPHFTKYDDSPGARGFVENSFISGLTPEELFFHAMGGRVGLIDTAVKSVTWETPVIVVENDEPKYVKIGEWIDAHISSASSSLVQRMTEQNMEYLELDHPVKIVTMDYDGHVSWETVSAVTRHDPGEKLYKITTHAGRYVTVTANKSLLVWNAELGQFREKYTDEIKVGDFVPVAKKVSDLRSGVGIHEIQMTKYFPKSEFIYGSEVKTAIKMMNESMQNRKKIPSNWWDENNNTAFTLPFDSKARLQRAIVRSKIDELSANGVYPPSGSRQWGIVPETFELNYENGTFIGLFIAEGNINGANIYITNNDSKIREFVKTWFAKYSIKCKEDIRKNRANGTTSMVVGTSCILAKFITQLVGHGADSKHVPNEAYISNMEFVKGIISGYISGDGHVSRNSIESSSCSQRLTEDIAFLCSRIGVHARVFKSQLKRNNFGTKNIKPSYRLSIRSTNGQLFADQIDLLHEQKNDRLKSIAWTSALNKVQQHNDVVLDAIVSIEPVDPALHPKMYDLTIPTTLNFGLANGLQVRDTSSTGYIQRRLIKGMEDLKIEYDMTVRNNKGRVIQFSYGEDGVDPVKVESQIMPLVNLGLDEIYAHYHMPSSDPKDVVFTAAFTKGVISRMKKQKAENDAKCKHWIDFMIEQREKIIQRVFRNKNTDRVFLPVAFAHTINNVKGLQQINNNSIVDITPLEAFTMIEAAYKRLEGMHYCAPTQLFKAMYFYYLSPKDLLMVKRFNKKALTVLLEMIVLKYKNSLIAPGEMVGMISAQSIGEPTTQLTLNTFHTAGSGVAMKANVTRGVPRIEELLSITENPKNSSLTICLKKDEETDCERAKELIAQIELTQLSELVESVSICFDPDDLNTLIQEDRSTMLQYYEYQRMLNECAGIPEEDEADPNDAARSKWIIRMVMSREAMLDKRITMDDVHFAIKNSHGDDVSCIYADYNADKLVFRLRMNNINGKKPLKPKENPLDQSDKIYLLKAFQDQLLNNIVLRGLKNISKVTLRKLMDTLHKEDGAYVKKETWVLDTKGTNLMDVLALDYIDVNRTISDDIQEIHSVLGIEAAREALLTEMTGVFENDGTYINYHHLSLLCDRMTASSGMVSIFRHGINNDNIGPIAKASFEETPEMFLKAARHAELDQMRGISANVMCGQEGYYGTSSFQVMLDLPQMIAKMEDVAFQAQNEQAEIAEAMGSAAADTSACAFEKLTIESNVGSIQKVDMGNSASDNYNVGF